MKIRIIDNAKNGLAIAFLMFSFLISASAQKTTLKLKNGKATVVKNFSPRRQGEAEADYYFLNLRKKQIVEIKVRSNSPASLPEENGCGMAVNIYDSKGKTLMLGDYPVGESEWTGEIKATGNYKIKVYMSCLEGFVEGEFEKLKPKFRYTLKVKTK